MGYLLPLPKQTYELATWKLRNLLPYDYHIAVNKMYYSVPHERIKKR